MAFQRRPSCSGFTLVETVVVLAIVGVLATVFLVTMSGLRSGDKVDRGAQIIYDDLVFIRGRAISANQNQRLNFLTTTQWRIESYNGAAWVTASQTRTMPADTYLTTASRANASNKLEATPRGLFTFASGASGTPYVQVVGAGTSKSKSIYVYVGGAIEFHTP